MRRRSAAALIRVSAVKPGESVAFKRDANYWGRDLPINRGSWNFDTIRFDYYRDGNTHFEAFKKGLYDVRAETDPGRWQTAYDFPALREGRVVKEEFPYGLPKGMDGLVFNTRRPIFADVRVREAILNLFDFEWINHTYFFDLYKRTASYFDGCDLSAHGVAANARERELLGAFSRRRARRHHGRQLGAAGQRRLGPRPRRIASRLHAVRRRRLRAQGHATGAYGERPAVRLRDPHHHARPGTPRARLRAQPQARRHRRARAQRGCHPVRAPAHRVSIST